MNANSSTDAKLKFQPRITTGWLQRYSMLIVLAALIVIFSILKPGSFFQLSNGLQILNNQAVVIVIALAAMVTLAAGSFDLSITATMSLSSALSVGLQTFLPWPVAVGVALLVGITAGFVNGVLIGIVKLNSFVVTLATQVIISGLVIWYTGGQVLFLDLAPDFLAIAGRGTIAGVLYPLLIALILVAVLWVFYEKTPAGRAMYAVGSNPVAARLSGLPTERLTIVSFVLGGLFAALAGVLVAAKLGSAQPDIGASYLLPAFAAAFLGASTIRPGRFNSIGTLIGVYVVAVGFTGLVFLGVPLWVQPVFYGLTLLAAVSAPMAFRRRRKRLCVDDKATSHINPGGDESGGQSKETQSAAIAMNQ
ncbi:ABC transporter permease (plasmid) [Rhodococcus globerulus]|uniref:ABC transporter permease n=1 Tax=Rhodococcus globerulus TaxID=33008 RepID=UPI0039EA7E10